MDIEELLGQLNITKTDGKEVMLSNHSVNEGEVPRIQKSCIERSKVPLRHFQIKAVKLILQHDRDGLLLVFPTGSGKSLCAVAASQGFLDLNPKGKVVFISPKSLIANFWKEFRKYGGIHRDRYETYTFCKAMHLDRAKTPIKGDLNTMVIIDEAHNLRNFYNPKTKDEGKQYAAVMNLCEKAGKRLLMTATPFVNDIPDLVSPINMIHGARILGRRSEWAESDELLGYLSKSKQARVHGPNRTTLRRFLHKRIYLLKGISKEHFPEYHEHVVEVPMPPDYEEKYEQLMEALEINYLKFANPVPFYNGTRRVVNKVNDDDTSDFTMKLLHMLPVIKAGKTLIYTNWIEFGVDPISGFLKTHGIKFRQFHGDVPIDKRTKFLKEYNEDKIQALIITKAGGEGIDLMGTRSVIVLDPTWNPTGQNQIRGRAIRYKSHDHLPEDQRRVDIYYMMLTSKKFQTGDVILYNIVRKKETLEDVVMEYLEQCSL